MMRLRCEELGDEGVFFEGRIQLLRARRSPIPNPRSLIPDPRPRNPTPDPRRSPTPDLRCPIPKRTSPAPSPSFGSFGCGHRAVIEHLGHVRLSLVLSVAVIQLLYLADSSWNLRGVFPNRGFRGPASPRCFSAPPCRGPASPRC